MRAHDWAALQAEFAALVELAPAERHARLDQIVRENADLGGRLAALLTADAEADQRLQPYELLSAASADPPPRDPLGLGGLTIAHFRVRDVLGSGGMGVAYRAEDTRLGRTVALKFLLPQYASDAEARRRFVHEARTASALEHPNVCTVLEIGECDHGLYIVMPAYPGHTLRERLARDGALAAADAIGVTSQLLRGLAAAHAAGITHRDLTPGNVVILPDGTVKILDFGLAKVRDLQLSAPGTRAGTIAYMSPEQLEAGAVDHRADLWAADVVLYALPTGTRPFGGGHDLSTVYSILHDEPEPPSARAPRVPRHLDDIVARLLRKEPHERFASAVDVLAALDEATVQSRSQSPVSRLPLPARHALARLPHLPVPDLRLGTVLTIAVLLVLLGATVAAAPLLRRIIAAERAVSPERASVAVLPFDDTSPAGDQAHLGDGVAEEILNALAQVPGLRVPARSSSFSFRAADVSLDEIARRLGVATVLEGSVHRAGDRIRITARLVDAGTNRYLWAQTFERRLGEMFTVQAEIAATVAQALRVRLVAPAGAPPPTRNAVAHELYLRGLFHWNRRTVQDLQHAIDFFTQATQHDSLYAQPYAGLALAYAVLQLSDPAATDAPQRSVDTAARALALDSTLAEAHAARGYAYHWQWRWEAAERELRRAVALNPAYATAHQWLGEHLAKMGRNAEGEASMRHAIALDPLSLVAQNDLGIVLMVGRRYEEAIAQFERVHRADPGFPIPLYLLHRMHLLTGNTAAAADAGRRWAELVRLATPQDMEVLARAVGGGDRAAALVVLERWQAEPAPRWPDIAMYYTLMGERDRAIAALQRGLAARTPMLVQFAAAPWADALRDDPRFAEILRGMGLAGRAGTG